MAIERYDISNDRDVYESWPDLVLTQSGRLICIFCECTHHSDRSYSRIVYKTSADSGRTWSEKRYLTEACHSNGDTCWDCPRISRLSDGRLAVLCNYVSPEKDRIFMWIGDAEGENWGPAVDTGAEGIVPDKLLEITGGRWILSCHIGHKPGFSKLHQRLWYSDDQGKSWTGPINVAKDARYNLCEGSILEVEPQVLVCFMRENSSEGIECLAACSEDGGLTWGNVYPIPLACCHRPVAGFLDTGEILITYRYRQGAQKGWLGLWTQNTFLAVTDRKTVLTDDRREQWVRIMPLHYDPSPRADLGYTGWVQFDDGLIYIVDYIVGTEEKAHIIGSSLYRSDIGGI